MNGIPPGAGIRLDWLSHLWLAAQAAGTAARAAIAAVVDRLVEDAKIALTSPPASLS